MDNPMSQTPVAPQQPSMPTPPSGMPPVGERSLASKMLWPLVSLVVIAAIAIGFAYWWNNRAEEPAGVSADPREAVIQGLSKLVAAKDGAFAFTMPMESLVAIDDYEEPNTYGLKSATSTGIVTGLEDAQSLELADRERYKDMVVRMSGAWAQTGATSTEGQFDFDLKSANFMNLGLNFRAFNADELYIQLEEFSYAALPIALDLSAIKGTWININVRQMLNDFGAGLGAAAEENPELFKLVQEQPTRFIVSDRNTYGKLLGDVLRRHDLLNYEKVADNKYKLTEKTGITDAQTDALAVDFIKTFVQQYLRDIDAAIARTQKAGDTKGTEQLQSYRKDLVAEAGEDGSKAADDFLESSEDETAVEAAETDSKAKADFFVTLNGKSGAVDQLIFQPVISAAGKDIRNVEPVEFTFSKLNSGLRVERPASSKSVYEMIPVFMGLMAGAGSSMDEKQ